jgi:hypothetical protein
MCDALCMLCVSLLRRRAAEKLAGHMCTAVACVIKGYAAALPSAVSALCCGLALAQQHSGCSAMYPVLPVFTQDFACHDM